MMYQLCTLLAVCFISAKLTSFFTKVDHFLELSKRYSSQCGADKLDIKEGALICRYVLISSDRSAKGGSVFTRWGRTHCPNGNEFVYRGYAGGNYFTTKAGPGTILCLPERPIYASHTEGNQGASHMYGTEYETSNMFPHFKRLHNQDIPCAVCCSQTKRTTIMVPARNKCFPGWRLEYWGYLMGGHYNHAAGNHICVDGNAEASIGGRENKDGQLMYLVESVCGSLPCPPYHQYWELTCAVCSKA